MADCRLYLVHVPTKKGIPLGVRHGWEYGGIPHHLSGRLRALFEATETIPANVDPEDFDCDYRDCFEILAYTGWPAGCKKDENGVFDFSPYYEEGND